jgi:hypothetical protein
MDNEQIIEQEQQTEQQIEQEQHTPEGAGNSGGSTSPSFDEMLQGGYQAEFDRRISKAIATAKANWEKAQADEQDEAAKLAKMNATERERYQLDKDKAAFAEQQARFAAQQMQVSVGTELQKRGLDAGFAKYLSCKTAEESKANLDEFQNLWNSALGQAVKGRMRGDGAPRDPEQGKGYTREELKRMTAAEINAHWDEIAKTLKK